MSRRLHDTRVNQFRRQAKEIARCAQEMKNFCDMISCHHHHMTDAAHDHIIDLIDFDARSIRSRAEALCQDVESAKHWMKEDGK